MEQTNLKELQKVQLEMLNELVRICKKNNIVYYLGDGSLLGGVRHKGFIPWDDDIDVLMTWENYEKFKNIVCDELDEKYFFQTTDTDKYWYRCYATIRKKNTAMIQNKNLKSHQGIWLDIFIIGNAKTKLQCILQKSEIMILNYLMMDHYMLVNKKEFKRKLLFLGYYIIRLIHLIPFNIRLKYRNYRLKKIASFKKGKYYPEIWCGITSVYDKDVFEGLPAKIFFEDNYYNAPHDTDKYLRTQYGDNYMIPVKWEKGHENLIIDFENDYKKYINRG
ncbi:MAG: LicD family protein [Clostridia bacterium]|nr:LicD family protein [Clostridia bacterium]